MMDEELIELYCWYCGKTWFEFGLAKAGYREITLCEDCERLLRNKRLEETIQPDELSIERGKIIDGSIDFE
jgi:NAD-dependent SIR2 family protein deacetylase